MKKREKSKSLIKNVGLFSLASFIPRVISFFLVPLYTDCLTMQEYGTMDLLTTTVQLLLPVLTLQIQDAVMSLTLRREREPEAVFAAGFHIVLKGFWVLLAAVAVLCAADILRMDRTYLLFFLGMYLLSALNNVSNYFLRGIDRVSAIAGASIANCVVTVSANLLFLLGFRWGINGYMLANLLGRLINQIWLYAAGGLGWQVCLKKADKELTREMVIFSLPLVLSALAWWTNNSLDRYMLTFFCGLSATGLMAVAYKIPTIISTIGSVVSKAFVVSVGKNFDPNDTDGFMGQSYALISFLMTLSASVLMIGNVTLSRLLFAKDFFAAWQMVPPLLFAAVMNLMSQSCEHICIVMKRTDVISVTALIGAGVNIALNLWLIPWLEGYGAVLATASSFAVVWLCRYLWVKSQVKLRNCMYKEFAGYLLLICQLVLAYWGNRYILPQIALTAILLLLYAKEIWGMLLKTKHITGSLRRNKAGDR